MSFPLPVIGIVGPTAAGKSDLALDIAEQLGGPDRVEIVGADASQLYRGMDIGTAKLPLAQRRGYVHHLIDVLDVTQDASVAAYQRNARNALADIAGRGKRAILVGGSGLYVRAVLDHIDFPGVDAQIRSAIEARAERIGTAALYAELVAKDPAAASAIGPANVRRIVRALEVIELTGRPFSANLPRQEYVVPAIQIGVDMDRADLDARIARRTESMFELGFEDEVRAIVEAVTPSRTAWRAVGYREVQDLIGGARTRDETAASITAATRRLARKQMGWFGRDPRVHWIRADRMGLAESPTGRGVITAALDIIAAGDAAPQETLTRNVGSVPSAMEPTRRTLGS
ncbi:tRNA (adenosine(37)-N6)-dimethylallyltransferase MiaA [Rarobacter incanus]|uniref:tRNA dimethylallyltransferase n=1 Tax=Rarobacter incanus TaxID=153494 RepID=A0A542SLF7_9MICO|nr:tRNA (adenosine(37)-N6)-dimethylallyltransferase MiaA [Rarobacter incanus]TQK75471.1 tRNA dimethylallyltransferase [Rarobacter incanus]